MRFQPAFARLHALYAPLARYGVVTKDTSEAFWLGTHEVRARDGYRTAFGGVEMRRSYVSAHLMPIYVHPQLLDDVNPALLTRRQGKACFNFKAEDDALFEAFEDLLGRSLRRFQADGRLLSR